MDIPELKRAARRASGGDEEAAAALFDHYYPRVFAYALAKLRNRPDAEDVASETFARVLRDLDRFKWKGSGFEAWIFRIASNLVVDVYRRATKEAPRDDVFEGSDPTLQDPLENVVQGETTAHLSGLIDALVPEQREVVLLRFAGGLDTKEVGRVMDRKANAVRQLQFRALENLRRMMREEVGARDA